ncbi:hypothetical protein [Alkalimonas mucilaginosa]|uniref:Flagellar protein FliT n=1 Tax=Alkalimonas mucilaginosa TaxID=3057676 RepID=A0ABU7JEB9_9GAMM|nr:hypothetical protein [Alkalimonas sp. MEB004]MEE2024044.1 hypothetical protein [Alkalimonas sp. MEB004]
MTLTPLQTTELARQLMRLQHNLLLAVRAQDWQKLRGLDRQLLALVKQLEQAGVKELFTAQLSTLRQNYQHVLELANNELKRTEIQMKQFNKKRQGLVAYRQTTEGKLS